MHGNRSAQHGPDVMAGEPAQAILAIDSDTRKVVRGLCLLGECEDAVYVVVEQNGCIRREGYFVGRGDEILRSGTEKGMFPNPRTDCDVAAFCAGYGGEYQLSLHEHRSLMRGTHFDDVVRGLAKGLFPEELVQEAIGAPVRLHVNY